MSRTVLDVPVGKVWQGQQAALMRLQLYAIGLAHEVLGETEKAVRDVVLDAAGKDGTLDGLVMTVIGQRLERVWKDGFGKLMGNIEGLRWEAAAIPLGTVAVLHNAQFANFKFQTERAQGAGRTIQEAGEDGPEFVFNPQIKGVLDAANERVYGDGLNWSGRVWNLERESLAGIQREVYLGVANGDSAWEVAKRIEVYLGVGQDCPRWTRTRSYGLTKKDIASGDRMGLYSGDECAAQGVAYKALRLARNEIQIAHHLATDAAMAKMPWVEKEKIELSPAHPEADICDDVVTGGENGDGVYPKGEKILPLHVQCLCWKSAVLMDRDEFARKLRGWMNGTEAWRGMDEYAGWIGGGQPKGLPALAAGTLGAMGSAYVTWLWGGEDALRLAVKRAVQLALGG